MSRIEEKLLKKQLKKKKIRNVTIVLMCFMFFVVMIYIADMKTSEMMIKKDGRHAVFFNIENEKDMRIDVAGKTFRFNIEYISRAVKQGAYWSKKAYNKILNILGS